MATTDTYKIVVDSDQAQRSLRQLQGSLDKTDEVFSKLKSTLAGLAIGSFIANAYQSANALSDMASAADVSVQSLLALQRAFIENGGGADQANNAVAKFNQIVGEAAMGTATAQTAFEDLGISMDDLSKLSTDKLLAKVLENLGKVKDSATRNAQAFGVFGKTIKGIDLGAVGAGFSNYFAGAQNSSAAIASAGQASQNFTNAINTLQVALLKALKPLSDFFSLIDPNAIESFISTIVRLGQVLAVLFVATKGAKLFADALQLLTGKNKVLNATLISNSTVLSAVKDSFKSFSEGTRIASRFFGFFMRDLAAGTLTFGKVIKDISALSFAFTRMVPLIGQAITAYIILDEVIKNLTNQDIAGWWDDSAASLETWVTERYPKIAKALNDLGKSMGMGDAQEIKKSKDALLKGTQDNTKATEDNAAAEQARQVQLRSSISTIRDSIKAYKEKGQEAINAFKLDTDLIGQNEKYVLMMQERNRMDQEYIATKRSLEQQLSKSTEKVEQAELRKALAAVRHEHSEELKQLPELVKGRIDAIRANQLQIFINKDLVDSNKKLRDIQYEISTALMPEYQKRIKDIVKAQMESAQAAIDEENARRGTKMSLEEENKYREVAAAKTYELAKAEQELIKAQRERALIDFSKNTQLENMKELRSVMDDTAKLTMTEIQKKEYDILSAAKERAKAEIEAENARRGAAMSRDEELRYYDAALKGTEKLIDATRRNQAASRSFATGWKQAMIAYIDDASSAAKKAERIFNKVMSGMEDAIVNFAKTGKFEWKQFAASVLEEMLRIQIQTLALKMLGGSSGSGGIFGAVGDWFAGFFANGGTIGSGKWGIVGEKGPEVVKGPATVTPMRDLKMQPIGQGQTVVYNISAVDTNSFFRLVSSDPGLLHAIVQQGAKQYGRA